MTAASAGQSRRLLTGTDLECSSIGLGCARLGGVFNDGPADEHEGVIRDAIEGGINFFDTADIYAQGRSEQLLGRILGPVRDQVVIASKFGYLLSNRSGALARVKPALRPVIRRLGIRRSAIPAALRTAPDGQDFTPEHMEAATEATLRRLGTDHVDILFLHSPSLDVLREGKFVEAAERLRRVGKVRWFGVSCEHASDVLAAIKWDVVSCIQLPLSLMDTDGVAAAHSAEMASKGVIARQCFASGLLAGGDISRYVGGRPARERVERQAQVNTHTQRALALGRSLPSAALAFSISTPGVSTSLVGAHTRTQLAASLAWANEPALSDSERFLLASPIGQLSDPGNGRP